MSDQPEAQHALRTVQTARSKICQGITLQQRIKLGPLPCTGRSWEGGACKALRAGSGQCSQISSPLLDAASSFSVAVEGRVGGASEGRPAGDPSRPLTDRGSTAV